MAASFVPSFLTPKKDRVGQINATTPSPLDPNRSVKLAASPFGAHYEKTGNISVQPLAVLPETEDIWVPSNSEMEEMAEKSEGSEEDDVFSAQWDSRKRVASVKKVTLSQLLDNVVILEEFMKEVSAIVQARRSLGVDPVRYL
jgi:hypothetical protein